MIFFVHVLSMFTPFAELGSSLAFEEQRAYSAYPEPLSASPHFTHFSFMYLLVLSCSLV